MSCRLIPMAVVLAALSASGCGGSKSSSGSSTPATFSQIYSSIIANRCAPCHTTPTGIGVVNGHLDMTSASTAYSNLVGTPAAGIACGGQGTRVVAGEPDSSIMYLKVSLDDPSPCGLKMPAAGGPLTQDQANMIESWIKAGALNN